MRTFGVGLLIVAAALVSACAPRQPAMVAGDGLKQDPQVVHGVLENGFQYFLLANQTPKDRVIVHLNIFAGSAHETDDEQGVAHYLEHLLFNGSEHFKPGELVAYFQSIGMDFGGDANAHTSFFKTVYDLNLPKGSRDYLEKGLLVIQDYAKGALLLEEEVAREKGIILAEKRERDSASYRTFKKSLAFELPNSLLTRRFPIGTTQVISSADRALLKGFYDRWYRPDNMALVMVGDFDVEMTKQMIQERFSQFKPRPAKPMVEPDISWIPHKGKKYFYHHEPESGSTTLTIERIDSVPFEGETESALKQRVLDDVADAVFQYRLDTLVRGESAGFTSASAYSGQFLRQLSVAAVTAD
ncbi:MAG: insulinase family protein, partial [Desulfobacterales bacterium]|nr:insulinase family protein [Desulfobacterales bacterium]